MEYILPWIRTSQRKVWSSWFWVISCHILTLKWISSCHHCPYNRPISVCIALYVLMKWFIHWALGDLKTFSISNFHANISDWASNLAKLPLNDYHWTLLMNSQHWFREWFSAIRQQAITWSNVDPGLCRHMASQGLNELTHWGRVTHICVGKLTNIGSDNGLSPGRRQAIIWTNSGILIIGPLETNFNEILIKFF